MIVAVRRGSGLAHLATVQRGRYLTVCASVLTGAGVKTLTERQWADSKRVCAECDEAAQHARNERHLAAIAGW